MVMVNIHQAKTHLSRFLADVENGKEVIIAKAGKPIAKLVSYKKKKTALKPGLWKGKVCIPDNFNDEDEEINKLFYEGEIFPKDK